MADTKSNRVFQCRDYLYEVFEQMSANLECSVDFLINESMREYARARQSAITDVQTNGQSTTQDLDLTDIEPEPVDIVEIDDQAADSLGAPPLPQSMSPVTAARPPLFLHYDGQRIEIAKDEFIIGRGSKTADLAIRDGNISRRHAAIVFHDGEYFIKDLGSTNGLEFGGRRVESKRIEEGDVYSMCEYEIKFSYQ